MIFMVVMNKSLIKYLQQAKELGCPKDQMLNFRSAGYLAQPRQLEVHSACRKVDNPMNGIRYIGAGGTRGQAKSHAFICQLLLDDMMRYDGLKCLYLRKIKAKANETLNDLRLKVLKNIPHDYAYRVITLENESTCTFGGYRTTSQIDDYLGVEYDIILIEDAPTLDKEKIDVIDGSCRTARMDGFVPRIYMSGNPGGIGHRWFVDMFLAENNPQARFIHFQLGDNKFIDTAYEKYLKSLTGWMYQAWALGDFNIDAGKFFKTFNRDFHVFDSTEFAPPPNWTYWMSIDYGYGHFTVAHLMCVNPQGIVYILDEYAARYCNVETNASGIKQILQAHGNPFITATFGGSDMFTSKQDGKSIAFDYAMQGIPVARANTSRITGASKILSLLGDPLNGNQPRLQISHKCHMLIEQLDYLIHDPNRPSDVLKQDCDDMGENGDDAYDCARYGLMFEHVPMDNQLSELLGEYRG